MAASMHDSFEQQRVARAKYARTRRRMKTLFKKAFELSSEDDTEVYLVAFRRGRFHEFNSMLDGANQVLFPPAPSVIDRRFPTTVVGPATFGRIGGGSKGERGRNVSEGEGRVDCIAGEWDAPCFDEDGLRPTN
ncbi:hypothetical protein C7999DRAFT_36624 [Corynascus novoguineensis]|uniref:MADS-box domain-containing protein n=1 Tax=Corynascus novoguineensis TaxID=1126955 RepID=A0AAN7CJ42_9PEZI|nr:hypothetical protein C7999DRAFT_36624 [Corynascus novoguineensis]